MHQVEVLILQHPLEVEHAKGSARLLHLSLPNSQLVTGEVFAEDVLHHLLTAPWATQTSGCAPPHAVLLYPETEGSTCVAPDPAWLHYPAQIRLVVIDGTWRKSRKMLHQNPLLQRLPRLALHDLPTSLYRVRQAHRSDQRSTLEATCAALAQIEGATHRFTPLLDAFDRLMAQLVDTQTRRQIT